MDSGGSGRKPLRVTIFHQPYTLRSSGEAGEVEQLAHEIDQLMENISNKTGEGDPARVAVLAALHLADRLNVLERQLGEFKQRIDAKSKELSLLLDRALE
jgi:cell division protein ZapA (FtsZ GTPase activity inhibitor)